MSSNRFLMQLRGTRRYWRALTTVWVLIAAMSMPLQTSLHAQTNCPSGIGIHVNSGEDMIRVWSPLSNGDYGVSCGWDCGGHKTRDVYSLDLNINGQGDLGKAVFCPITGRVWTAYLPPIPEKDSHGNIIGYKSNYGNTVLIWDPGSGIVIRLAHLDSFSSVTYNTGAGSWLGAGTKAGYIGKTGCLDCGPHLHMTAYRNVKVGVQYAGRPATEQDIIDYLSRGSHPPFAQAQKFRLIAPSDNCDLIRFDSDPTVYTNNNGTLYPVTPDGWRSLGLALNLNPQQGQYDTTAGSIPIRVLPAYQRGSYYISSEFAWPRRESVFRGNQYQDTYVFRWGQKNLLNANQFGDQAWHEYRWSEVQVMDQNFVDKINPLTVRTGSPLEQAKADLKRVLDNDSRFNPVTLSNDQFWEDLNWDANYELRWGYFKYRGTRLTVVYHASNKTNRGWRYYLIWNPDTGGFEGWYWCGD